MRNRIFCNLEFLFLFTFEGNIQCAKKGITSPCNALTVINNIVFTSPEAMVGKIVKSVSMRKPGRSRQEVIQLKSPILLKLGTNVVFGK